MSPKAPTKTIYREDYRRLIERLRARREHLRWSQGEVARRLGWSQQRLSAVEAGARRLDVIEFWQLTGVLGLSAARLLALLRQAP
ncbi:MAG TPA: helix-turn-helix transcriptional regulator [Telluria sp.]